MDYHRYLVSIFVLVVLLWVTIGCNKQNEHTSGDSIPVPVLTPEEELETFQLAPGLRIELVASEPLIEDPVAISFDEDGRLWVVEMRGFMPDIDGTNEEAPIGRISILYDDDGDGEMDRSSVFLDSLVLPRALAIVQGGALIAENKPLWYVEDTNGDLIADKKTLVDSVYGGSGLPEHSANGLLRGLDNWYYNAKSRARYKFVNGEWQQEETEFRGQWGISHDDTGRLYYNYNWSQLHADLVPPNYLNRNPNHKSTSGLDVGLTLNRSIFPIRSNPAVNRGYVDGSLDENGRLREFTSAGAPFVYRGRALPEPFYGNVFVCEPAGNLIKCNIVEASDFSLSAHFAYPDREFLASTDERFRPVNLSTGPDGALYVVDMYRGLIQHGAYITEYLREITVARGLEAPVHLGRIWRIVPEDWVAPDPVSLSEKSTAELVQTLSHPDGWYRDTAQRLIVERGDPVAPELLHALVQDGDDPRGRLHALWALEGLQSQDTAIFLYALSDQDPAVQSAALRILETHTANDIHLQKEVNHILQTSWQAASPEFSVQMALSADILPQSDAFSLLANLLIRYPEQPVVRDAIMSSLGGLEFAFLETLWELPDWQQSETNASIFLEMLASAVVRGGTADELKGLLALTEQELHTPGWRSEALLTSISVHGESRSADPIQLKAQPVLLASDQTTHARYPQLLTVLNRLFAWPGQVSDLENEKANKPENDKSSALAIQGRQLYLTGCSGCHGLEGEGLPRFAPPLVHSEWVVGTEERLVRLVLHGVEGPIEVGGKLYKEPEILTVMPAHSVLDDTEIASILTYIRQAWGNEADPVLPGTVGRIRHGSQGKVTPWTADELLQIPEVPASR